MPQPLSRVSPTATVDSLGYMALRKRPELAALVGQAIASWSDVETWLLRLFVHLFGGNKALAAQIYLQLDTKRAKSLALEEVINTVANPKRRSVIKAVMGLVKIQEKTRDKLAHHTWALSDKLNNELLLIDPKSIFGRRDGRIAPSDEVYVYRAKDLESIIEANHALCVFGISLFRILTRHPSNKGGRLLRELCREPEIRERLDRQASQARSAQAEPS